MNDQILALEMVEIEMITGAGDIDPPAYATADDEYPQILNDPPG